MMTDQNTEYVVLIDGSGERAPLLLKWKYGDLGPGWQIFVRFEGSWFRRCAVVRAGRVRVVFAMVTDVVIVAALDDAWRAAQAKPKRSDDVPFLGLALAIDISQSAILAHDGGHVEVARPEYEIQEADAGEKHDEYDLEQLNDLLGGVKDDLEFHSCLLKHAKQIHHALHLVALGQPAGLVLLVRLVLAAMGHTLMEEYDFETVALDVMKRGAPAVRIEIEMYEIVRTGFEIRDLLSRDGLEQIRVMNNARIADLGVSLDNDVDLQPDIGDSFAL